MKVLLNVIGTLAVLLGVLGIFLPLLPTTPFLLLASACYLRGSTRMHRWLTGNRLFGPYLRNLEERRGLPLRAKVVTLVFMWISLLFSMTLVASMLLWVGLAAIGVCVSIFLLRLPTLRPSSDTAPNPDA